MAFKHVAAPLIAGALFGSIAITAPQASAAQPNREIVPAASSTLPKPNLSPDCIQALKDEGKLSTEIKKQLLIAGLSAKDAARLAPKIAAEILTEKGIVIKESALSAIIAKDLGAQGLLLSDAAVHKVAAGIELNINATLIPAIIAKAGIKAPALTALILKNLGASAVGSALILGQVEDLIRHSANPATWPFAANDIVEIGLILRAKGVHVTTAGVEAALLSAVPSQVVGDVVLHHINHKLIVKNLVKSGLDEATAKALAPKIASEVAAKIAAKPALLLNSHKLINDVVRQVLDGLNTKDSATKIVDILKNQKPALDKTVKEVCFPSDSTPTADPTDEPTADPTDEPTADPTVSPTDEPTVSPTDEPTVSPTDEPTVSPTAEPTDSPTGEATIDPSDEPTAEPTAEPTVSPTSTPIATAAATLTPAHKVAVKTTNGKLVAANTTSHAPLALPSTGA